MFTCFEIGESVEFVFVGFNSDYLILFKLLIRIIWQNFHKFN